MKWWPTPTVAAAAGAGRQDHHRRRRLFGLAVHHRPGAGPGHRQPAGAVCVQGLSLRDQGGGHQQAGLRAVPGRGAHRRLFRHGADDGRDRPRGRTRTLGNPPGEPGAGRTDALRQRHRQAPGQRRLSGQPAAGHGHDRCGRYPRAPAARRGRRPPHRRGPGHLHGAGRARHLGVRRLGHARHSGLRPGHGPGHARWRAGAVGRRAFARAGHGTTLPRSPTRSWAWTWPASSCCMAIPGRRHFPPAPMPRARW